MSDSVVVGWIQSPEGQAAVEAAVEEIRRRQGRLVVVHSSRGGGEDAAKVVANRDALDAWRPGSGPRGWRRPSTTTPGARTRPTTSSRLAGKEDAALIVIGLRRRSPGRQAADRQQRAGDPAARADCPVLAVKAK